MNGEDVKSPPDGFEFDLTAQKGCAQRGVHKAKFGKLWSLSHGGRLVVGPGPPPPTPRPDGHFEASRLLVPGVNMGWVPPSQCSPQTSDLRPVAFRPGVFFSLSPPRPGGGLLVCSLQSPAAQDCPTAMLQGWTLHASGRVPVASISGQLRDRHVLLGGCGPTNRREPRARRVTAGLTAGCQTAGSDSGQLQEQRRYKHSTNVPVIVQ